MIFFRKIDIKFIFFSSRTWRKGRRGMNSRIIFEKRMQFYLFFFFKTEFDLSRIQRISVYLALDRITG